MPGKSFLLDTNILSNDRIQAFPRLRIWLEAQNSIAICFPVLVEIEQGIAKVRNDNPAKALALRNWLDKLLSLPHLYPEPSPSVARLLGEMHCCSPLRKFWQPPASTKDHKPDQDLFIAAMAIVHNLPIATLNLADFIAIDRHFPLPGVLDPAAGLWGVSLKRTPDVAPLLRPRMTPINAMPLRDRAGDPAQNRSEDLFQSLC